MTLELFLIDVAELTVAGLLVAAIYIGLRAIFGSELLP